MKLKNLTTNFLGRNLFYYEKIDSTQSEIWRLIEKRKIKNGSLILANIQTDGIGTHGRRWYTDEVNNIAFSCFIILDCNINKLSGITVEIANIIVEIFKDRYNIDLEVKEPNDIVYNNKKIGGILTETKLIAEQVKYMVLGIGINTSKVHFTKDIKDIATSIKIEFGIEVKAEEFVTDFCNRFENKIIKCIGE